MSERLCCQGIKFMVKNKRAVTASSPLFFVFVSCRPPLPADLEKTLGRRLRRSMMSVMARFPLKLKLGEFDRRRPNHLAVRRTPKDAALRFLEQSATSIWTTIHFLTVVMVRHRVRRDGKSEYGH